jgi:hypothetical protein
VTEKPQLYQLSNWTFPWTHWGEVGKENATGNQKILGPALADGTPVGYGDDEKQVHFAEGFTHDNWWQAHVRVSGRAGPRSCEWVRITGELPPNLPEVL